MPFGFHRPLPNEIPALAPRDRVRTPDRHIGEVVGFYRGEDDSVLVRLANGVEQLYKREDLQLLIG
jgi:hypothetical protein